MENLKVKDEFELPIKGKSIKVKYDGISEYPDNLKFSFFSDAFGRRGKKTVLFLVKKFKELSFQDYIECAYTLALSHSEEIFCPSPALPAFACHQKGAEKQPIINFK